MSAVEFVFYVNVTIIWYFLLVNVGYLLLLITSIPDILARYEETTLGHVDFFVRSNMMPPITAIVAAYNEEDVIMQTIHSLIRDKYLNLHICVVNDGSDDKTMQVLMDNFDLIKIYPVVSQEVQVVAQIKNVYCSRKHKNIIVIDKEHSGKSDSLNIGINACTTPLFLTIDADTVLEPHAISNLAFSMLSQPHTLAEGGAIYVLNGCDYKDGELLEAKMASSPLVAMQTCEYLRAFLFGRTGWKPFKGPLILSGAFTLFERKAVIEIGGYVRDTPGEDMEVIVSLHDRMRLNDFPYRIGYTFAAAAWTHVPTDMNTLWNQRGRWHRGLIDSLLRHWKMMLNPLYGATGMVSYPFQFLVEFLGPIIEFIGYAAVIIAMYFTIIDWQFAILFFVATWGFATVLTLGTTLISMISFNKYQRLRDIIILFFLVIFESIGYRQILALCRVVATFQYFWHRLFKRYKNAKNVWK